MNTVSVSSECPMPELVTAFRLLRAAEREWEDESRERDRMARNAELRSIFNADTESIIAGKLRPVAPQCEADLYFSKQTATIPS